MMVCVLVWVRVCVSVIIVSCFRFCSQILSPVTSLSCCQLFKNQWFDSIGRSYLLFCHLKKKATNESFSVILTVKLHGLNSGQILYTALTCILATAVVFCPPGTMEAVPLCADNWCLKYGQGLFSPASFIIHRHNNCSFYQNNCLDSFVVIITVSNSY